MSPGQGQRDDQGQSAWEKTKRDWFKLDNAAILFPTIVTEAVTTLFRLQATLRKPIKVETLQQALNNIYPRFPYYMVELHAGFFWYYFSMINRVPRVMADSKNPMRHIHIKRRGCFLFRVRAYKTRIAVEFSHILTDGSGALVFLKSLVTEYLRLLGQEQPKPEELAKHGIFPAPGTPASPTVTGENRLVDPEEFEDAFRRHYRKIPAPDKMRTAFHLPGTAEGASVYRLVTAITPTAPVIAKAKASGASLTEYLGAVYLAALQDISEALSPRKRRRMGLVLRIMVPVNLRKLYATKTMRNFSLYVLPGIDLRLGHFEFEEILHQVIHYMRANVNEKVLSQQISRNVGSAKSPLIRLIPLALKKPGGKLLYRSFGEYLYSGCLTNLGPVTLPEELMPYVERVEFLPAGAPLTKSNIAMVSFGDSLYISFGRVIKPSQLERAFITRLVRAGFRVRVETNE